MVFVDESGFYLLPGAVRSYAPCGQTPVLRIWQAHDHVSVMSGITPSGQIATLVREFPLTGAQSVRFLQHLQRYIAKRLLVIWDGSPIHKGEVRAFLSAGGAKFFHVEQLPPYAPDLNPDEGVWQQLKQVELCNLCCQDLRHLRRELHLAIRRLRSKPHLIQACFAGAQLCTKT